MNRDSWVYFGVGLGLGAVVATLFAPASGADTRQMIAQKTSDGIDQLKSQGQAWKGAVTDTVNDTVQRTKDTVNDTMQRTKDSVQKAGRTLQYSKDNLSAAVQGAKDAYREAVATTPGV
jgi:gas vesicle protein